MNRIIRHAYYNKTERNNDSPLSEEEILKSNFAMSRFYVCDSDIYKQYLKKNPHINLVYKITTSSTNSSKMTGAELFKYLTDFKNEQPDLRLNIVEKPTINSLLNDVNFKPEHNPDIVGPFECYKKTILDNEEAMYDAAARQAEYILETLSSTDKVNHIGVSHTVPMMLFLYVLGKEKLNHPMFDYLKGISYYVRKESDLFHSKQVLFFSDGNISSFQVKEKILQKIALKKYKV